MHWLFILSGIFFFSAVLGFSVTSFRELEKRAGFLSLSLAIVFGAVWFWIGFVAPGITFNLGLATLIIAASTIIFLSLPIGKAEPLKIHPEKTQKFDERHIMFSRMGLKPETPQYEEYYLRISPELKKFDDNLRSLPDLGEPGAKYFSEIDSPYMIAIFEFIENIRNLAEPGPPVGGPIEISPNEATRRIKGFARHLGALDVRVTRLRDYHIYSHAGRQLHNWGQEIHLDHKYAIVFSTEMGYPMVHTAPLLPTATESSLQYMRVACAGICLANYIKYLGYRARAHIDGNYHVLTTAIAHDAGLGELGRLGLIITPTHGPRVRTAVVTTDLELIEDKPINIGVQHFCEICKKCAENCPSQSIEKGDKREVRGVEKWQTKTETCYHHWRVLGTDCAICLAVCPYSKPASFYHNLLRFFIHRNPVARKIALVLDDLFYGRKHRYKKKPPWFSSS
ncbi:MAG: reductive dehalogenase [Deltaproteobacteria bacterium]|nr:reductive dehalogenase [Deltaproteobacteria bacterium]